MGKRVKEESKNRQSQDSMKVEVRDVTYRITHRGTYNLNDIKALYDLLKLIEKFSSYTITQIVNKNKWI